MSMLAQPRVSKKYVLQPRGKPLYEDETRFGSRMLQKMGWSKGKGLGRKENGEINIIELDYKNDSSGLGFEDRNDQWTQHDASFNQLLKNLNENTDPTFSKVKETANIKEKFSGESLEKKSKSSKVRVHYQKFTKGKDISQYSAKDLANIFGMKSFENVNNGCQLESNRVEKREKPEEDLNIKEKYVEPQEELSDASVKRAKKRKRKNISEQSDFLEKHDQRTLIDKEKASIDDNAEKNVKRKTNSKAIKEEEGSICKSEKIKVTVLSPQKVINSNSVQVLEKEASNKKKKRKNHTNYENHSHSTDVEKQDDITLTTGLVEQLTTIDGSRFAVEHSVEQEAFENDWKTVKSKKNSTKSGTTDNKSRLTLELPIEQEAFKEEWKTVRRKTNSTKTSYETPIQFETNLTKNEETDNPLSSEDAEEKYIISTFCAEKFRNVALDQFNGSNLVDIIGYGLNENINLEIQYKKNDQYHIINLWDSVLDKYNDANPKNRHSTFVEKAKETFQNHISSRKKKTKLVKPIKAKKLRKKQVFQRL